jgi:hypothetical protein
MRVSVGVAVLAEDGRDYASLIDAAEQAMFVVAASGVEVGGAGPSGEPQAPGPGPRLVS